MKSGLVACLLFSLACLAAQIPEELTELDYAAQAEAAWEQIYQELRGQPFSIDARATLAPANTQFQASAACRIDRAELLLNYNHRLHDALSAGSFRLHASSPRWDLVLGSYRFSFGRGLVSGSNSRAQPDSLFSLPNPLSPRNFSPQGAVLTHRYRFLRGAVFASVQYREAKTDTEGQIRSLPKTRSGGITATREDILGLAAGVALPRLRAGGLLYWRQYDRDFAETGTNRSLWAASLYAAFTHNNLRLDGEAALAEGIPSALLTCSYKLKDFSQSISYGRNGLKDRLPYALSPGVLSTAASRDEINGDLSLGLPLQVTLKLRYTISGSSGFDGGALSRFTGSLGYSDRGSHLKLLFHNYDREIISLVDSNYVSSEPRNWRIQLSGQLRFQTNFYQRLDFSYTLQDKFHFSRNTHRVRFGFAWEHKDWELGLDYLAWQSAEEIWLMDELDPYTLLPESAEDKLLVADLAWRRGSWRLGFQGRKSFLYEDSYRLWLRWGWSWPGRAADSA